MRSRVIGIVVFDNLSCCLQTLARFEPLPVEQWPESIIHRFLQVLLAPEVTPVATSNSIGVSSFNGVAISE